MKVESVEKIDEGIWRVKTDLHNDEIEIKMYHDQNEWYITSDHQILLDNDCANLKELTGLLMTKEWKEEFGNIRLTMVTGSKTFPMDKVVESAADRK